MAIEALIEEITNSLVEKIRVMIKEELNKPDPIDRLYNVKEAAEILRVSVSTLHRLKDRGLLGYLQEGQGIVRFHHEELQKYLKTYSKKARYMR